MTSFIKRLASRLTPTPKNASEKTTERPLVIATEQVTEMVVQQLRMRTIFPHPPVLSAGDSYGDWYSRVADVWQRRRAMEMQLAPTDDLRRVMASVMTERMANARAACTTLH